MHFQIRDEFQGIVNTDKQLQVEWSRYKDAILVLAEQDATTVDLRAELEDDMDEGLTWFLRCMLIFLEQPSVSEMLT